MKRFNIVYMLLSAVTVSSNAMDQVKQGPNFCLRPESLSIDLSLVRQDSFGPSDDTPKAPRHKPLQVYQGWAMDASTKMVLASKLPTSMYVEKLEEKQSEK